MLMHQGDLHAALHGAVANETIRYAHKLCGIDQSEAGVTLEFENGETVIYDAVIASDGAFAGADWMLARKKPVLQADLPIARRFRRS